MRFLFLVMVVVLPLLLLACGDQQGTGGSAQRQVHGEFLVGDTVLHYVATFQDTTLVAVVEEQSYGNDGQAHARYEVVDGRLVYYRIDEQRRVVGTGDGGDFAEVSLELEFDAAGRIRRQTKLVDGELSDLVGYEVPGVQLHFEELKRRVDLAQGTALGGM